ncbi:extracellular ligand-binding receptor [Kalymmatonema gypsitolerans NIES-4073]|nr:extracellular ligand-binding receptor [Scytonema sp. NIES-4073]
MTDTGGRRKNPYIIGLPIDKPELLFGRESLFGFIEDNLRQKVKVILLHGQRRIGKSSVLKQIPNFFAQREFEEFVFVNFDLQDKANLSLSQVLHALATDIVNHLVHCLELIPDDKLTPPTEGDLETRLDVFYRNFLPQVYQELSDKNLVLLLDEFDVLDNDDNTRSADKHFFQFLKELLDQQEQLFIIPVVGRNLDDMQKLLSLFKNAPYQEIGLLDGLSAQRLITRPAQGTLEYDQDAISAILELSAGHPYFTQIISNALFGKARERQNWRVTRADVDAIIDKAIENAEGGLDWFWQGLPLREQVVFSAVAEAQTIAISKDERVPEEPLTLLKSYGVETESLEQAARQLADRNKGFLDDTGRRVKVELVRRWLVKRHPLRQEIWKLENLEQEEVNSLWEVATRLRQQGKRQNARAIYKQILALNPNHFRTVAVLAEECLEQGDFDQAVELYTRAHQVDPVRHKQGLLPALQEKGERQLTRRDLTQAKEQFHRILAIEPDNRLAQERLQEIEAEEANANRTIVATNQRDNLVIRLKFWLRRKRIALAVIGTVAGIIAVVGVGVYRVLTPCAAGQHKIVGIICVADPSRISRGERTLFPRSKNDLRDKGIEAFKQRKYPDAAEFFKRAVAANRNDPEVLIYYNNARAYQLSSRLTLAAVVPVDKAEQTAQEILRGVAHAQNQFNEKGGLNGQLLEIVLANDGDEPDKAQQVAQDVVKDESILGVIGHNSSECTQKALPEYYKAKLAIVSPTSSSIFLSEDVFFRTVPSDTTTGKTLAKYAYENLGLRKVVIFYNPKSPYSDSLREEFKNNFEQLEGKVVHKIDLTKEGLDAEKEIAKSLYTYQAQAAVLFPDTQRTTVALQIAIANAERTAKLQNSKRAGLKLLGGDTLYSDTTLKAGGNAVEGLIIGVPWFRKAPKSKKFAQAAVQQWKGGEISWRTATSFDATQAFIKAFSNPPSRFTVLQRLREIKLSSSETSGHPLQFTPDRERDTKPILVRVVGGKFELVKELTQTESSDVPR